MPKESTTQKRIIDTLEERLPGVQIFKGDTRYKQGSPDLLVLHGSCWAALEVKKSSDADKQPNQDYYVDLLNNMSFAAFIHPENEGEILDGLQRALTAERCTRVS